MSLPDAGDPVMLLHNPRCSKSRAALALIEEKGIDVTVRPYLEESLDRGELAPSDRVLQVPPERDGITVLTELFFGLAADDGLEVWVFPPGSQENADSYQEFIELGADGVIAGRPGEAVERYREVFGG